CFFFLLQFFPDFKGTAKVRTSFLIFKWLLEKVLKLVHAPFCNPEINLFLIIISGNYSNEYSLFSFFYLPRFFIYSINRLRTKLACRRLAGKPRQTKGTCLHR